MPTALLAWVGQHRPTDYGHDRFVWLHGLRHFVGAQRSFRPADGETAGAFRDRVATAIHAYTDLAAVQVEHVEEIRAGVLIQIQVTIGCAPIPLPPNHDDAGPAGGRLQRPRGRRGGITP